MPGTLQCMVQHGFLRTLRKKILKNSTNEFSDRKKILSVYLYVSAEKRSVLLQLVRVIRFFYYIYRNKSDFCQIDSSMTPSISSKTFPNYSGLGLRIDNN